METTTPAISKSVLWTGRVLSVLPCLMLAFSGVMKFNRSPSLEEGFAHLQLNIDLAVSLGVLELACMVIYLIPRTAVLGAILLTGYLGGAMLTHLRVGDPWIVQSLLGVALWAGLWLRDPRLRVLIPLVKP